MKSFRSKPVGWRGESYRHQLAAKGVSTAVPQDLVSTTNIVSTDEFRTEGVGSRYFPPKGELSTHEGSPQSEFVVGIRGVMDQRSRVEEERERGEHDRFAEQMVEKLKREGLIVVEPKQKQTTYDTKYYRPLTLRKNGLGRVRELAEDPEQFFAKKAALHDDELIPQ